MTSLADKIKGLFETAGPEAAAEVLANAGQLDEKAIEAGLQSKEKEDEQQQTEALQGEQVQKMIDESLVSKLAPVLASMDRIYVDIYGSVSKELSEDQAPQIASSLKSLEELNIPAQLEQLEKSIDELRGNVPALGVNGGGYRASEANDTVIKEKDDDLNPVQKAQKEDYDGVMKVLSI